MKIPEASRAVTDLTVSVVGDDFVDKHLWRIVDVEKSTDDNIVYLGGVFRRVARKKQGLMPSVEGNLVAIVDHAVREFRRWKGLDKSLLAMGYSRVDENRQIEESSAEFYEDDDDLFDDDDVLSEETNESGEEKAKAKSKGSRRVVSA